MTISPYFRTPSLRLSPTMTFCSSLKPLLGFSHSFGSANGSFLTPSLCTTPSSFRKDHQCPSHLLTTVSTCGVTNPTTSLKVTLSLSKNQLPSLIPTSLSPPTFLLATTAFLFTPTYGSVLTALRPHDLGSYPGSIASSQAPLLATCYGLVVLRLSQLLESPRLRYRQLVAGGLTRGSAMFANTLHFSKHYSSMGGLYTTRPLLPSDMCHSSSL